MRKKAGNPVRRRGYGAYVTAEAMREWSRLPIRGRLEWIVEMIRLEARLPAEVREWHRRFRTGEI